MIYLSSSNVVIYCDCKYFINYFANFNTYLYSYLLLTIVILLFICFLSGFYQPNSNARQWFINYILTFCFFILIYRLYIMLGRFLVKFELIILETGTTYNYSSYFQLGILILNGNESYLLSTRTKLYPDNKYLLDLLP